MRGAWSGPAHPGTVGQLRRSITEFAVSGGLDGLRLEELRACVSEAVTNAVVHAYRDGREPGTIQARAEFRGGALSVRIVDDGMGFRPRSDSPGLGLGMPTIAALTTSMSVTTPPQGGTELCMEFAVDQGAPPTVYEEP